MSNDVNTRLLERASELLDEIVSHPSGLDKALEQAIENNDLDEVHRLVSYLEGELAMEHFHKYDIGEVY